MQVVGNSPVDLTVTDPDGFTVTKTVDEAGDLLYREFDFDEDGELEDIVYSWDQKVGDYLITVIPETGAAPNDTYTIEVLAGNATTIVAQNASVAEIPTQPYIVTSNETTLIPRLDPHDIGITQFITSKTVVGQNFSLPSSMSIFNYGNDTEAFDVTVYANTTIIATFANVTLASKNSTAFSILWDTTGFARGNCTIWAYASPVLGETYTTDNNFTSGIVAVAMIGDVDANGKVDVKDVYEVALTYGTSLEGPNPLDRTYDPNCDINGDDKIDVKDYYVVCKHYGEVNP